VARSDLLDVIMILDMPAWALTTHSQQFGCREIFADHKTASLTEPVRLPCSVYDLSPSFRHPLNRFQVSLRIPAREERTPRPPVAEPRSSCAQAKRLPACIASELTSGGVSSGVLSLVGLNRQPL